MEESEIARISLQISEAYVSKRMKLKRKNQPESQASLQFKSKLLSSIALIKKHGDMDLQDYVRELIPIEDLHTEAFNLLNSTDNPHANKGFEFNLVIGLLGWFKSFFKWTNSPQCAACGQATTNIGTTMPNEQESSNDASRTEIFKCSSITCLAITRFPRYNNPRILFSTRTGRCGEYANAFAVVCRTMGLQTRYVLDFTDHVWVEFYSEHLGRWIHADSCEGRDAIDCPLMYESGWGKKLTYVIAFGDYEVVDVTRRYSAKYCECLDRRTTVNEVWLLLLLQELNENVCAPISLEMIQQIKIMTVKEQIELATTQPLSSQIGGRQSGSIEWRTARNEMGN